MPTNDPDKTEKELNEQDERDAFWIGVHSDTGLLLARIEKWCFDVTNERDAYRKALGGASMGVGDGRGTLFVHGTAGSIEAAQAIVRDRDELRVRVKLLQDEVEALRARVQELEAQLADVVNDDAEPCQLCMQYSEENADLRSQLETAQHEFRDYAEHGVRPDWMIKENEDIKAQFIKQEESIVELSEERDRLRAAFERYFELKSRALSDPGAFTPRRDDFGEALGSWQARAVEIALREFTDSLIHTPEEGGN